MIKLCPQLVLGVLLAIGFLPAKEARAQRQMEKLGRSVVAMAQANGNVYVGWRLLGTDPEETAFNLYRSTNGGAPVLLASNRTQTTDYVDTSANLSFANSYFVRPVLNGVEGVSSAAFVLYPGPSTAPYINIPFQFRPGDPTPSTVEVYPADIDGDGEYEYLVRWSHSGYIDAGEPVAANDTYKLEAYRLDGTKLPWRVDLGWNVMTGLEISPATCYDLDGDGKAEFICMSAEGATDGTGVTIGDTDGDGKTDYRDPVTKIVYSGPRFLSVYSGLTGKELARAPWPARVGGFSEYARNNLAIAYLDGVTPSIIVESAHDHTVIEAWNYRNGQLTKLWNWSVGTNDTYRLKGSHMSHIADVTGDGKDKILIGTLALNSDGTPLWVKPEGHGDYFHVGDFDPDRPGLEMVAAYESAGPRGFQTFDAGTGKCLWSVPTSDDSGECGVAPFFSTTRGYQCWGGAGAFGGFFDIHGNLLNTSGWPSEMNLWWDAEPCREISNNGVISKYDGSWLADRPYNHAGWADLLGDWREEELDFDSTGIRIYTTTVPATNRMYTLMHDHQYRAAAAMVNQRKLPPLYPSFYIGPGMATPPLPPVSDAQLVWRGGLNGNAWDANTTANWRANAYWSSNSASCNFTPGATVLFDLTGSNNAPVSLSGTLSPAWVKVHSGTDYVFAGTGSLSGTTKVLKGGRGTLTISNTNTYSGSTLVAEGELRINGRLEQSPVIARGGGAWGPTLVSGTGYLGNGLTVQAAAGISPGSGTSAPGTLMINKALTLSGSTVNYLGLSDDPTGTAKANDLIKVTGSLALSGSNLLVIQRLNGALSAGTYPLITYTGSLSGGLSNLSLGGVAGVPCSLVSTPGLIALQVRAIRAPANITWSGTGGAYLWDLANSSNWSNGGTQDYFAANDTVLFDDSGAAHPIVTLSEIMPIAGMVVNSSTNYTIQGNGCISGTGGLLKSGSGTLSLLTSNDYTGGTTVGGGILEVNRLANGGIPSSIGAASSDPANWVIYGGCTFRLVGLASESTDRGLTLTGGWCTLDVPNAKSDMAIIGTCVGDGGLLKTGSGMLVMRTDVSGTPNNSYAGGTMVAGGSLQVSDDSDLGLAGTAVTLSNGGLLDLQWATNFNRPLILGGGGGTLNARTSGTLSSITGSGKLTLTGALRGIFTISGSNNYSGGTVLKDGAIWISKPTSLGTGSVTIATDSELRFRPGATSLNNNLNIAGTGVATQSTSAAIYLSAVSATLFGSLTLSDDATISCANTSGLNLTQSGAVSLGANALTLAPGLADTTNVVNWVINGVIGGTGDLVWDASSPTSTLKLTAANTFTGNTTVNDVAPLVIGHSLALQNSSLNCKNGTVQFASGITACTLGALSGSRNLALVNLSGTAVTLSIGNNNRSTVYSGAFSQGGSLVKIGAGTLTLSGSSNFTGSTTISSGTLALSGVLGNCSAFSVGAGAMLKLAGGSLAAISGSVAASGTVYGFGTINSPVTNDGVIRVNGLMAINGAVNITGTILVPYGSTLVINGPVTNAGVVDADGTVNATSSWSGAPILLPPPAGTFTNTSAGNWSSASWQPSLPASGIGTSIVLNNSVAISSTNDLGALSLNQLSFKNQAATLGGNRLEFDGPAPLVSSTLNVANTIANTLTLNQDTTFAINANTTTLTGLVEGVGAVNKTGAGTLILSGSNTYSGGTLVTAGTLTITSEANLGAAGTDLTLGNGSVLRVITNSFTLGSHDLTLSDGGGVIANSTALTLDGLVSGTGSLTKINGGVLTLTNGGNSYTGGTFIQGAVEYSNTGAFGTGPVTISSGAQITFRPNGDILRNDITLAGTGGGSGALFLNGADAVTLTGSVTLTGNTTFGAGNTDGMNLTLKGPLNLGANTLTLKPGATAGSNSQHWALNGSIAGTGNLTLTNAAVNGSPTDILDLSGSNSFSGVTSITTPAYGVLILNINHVNALQKSTLDTGSSGTQQIAFTVSGNNTYNLGGLRGGEPLFIGGNTLSIGNNGSSTTYSGAISGYGCLTKVGSGSLTLTGTHFYTGNTTVSKGALFINGSSISAFTTVQATGTLRGSGTLGGIVQVQGCLSPGDLSGGSTFNANEVAFADGGILKNQLNGTNNTSTSLQVAGNLSMAPTALLSASYSGTSAPAIGTRFVIASYRGTWNGVTFSGMPEGAKIAISGYYFTIKYADAGAVTLTASAAPTAFESWATSFGLGGNSAASGADPDGDGDPNLLEFATDSSPAPGPVSRARIYSQRHLISGTNALTLTMATRSGATFSASGNKQQSSVVDGIAYVVEGSSDLSGWDGGPVGELSPSLSAEVQGAFSPPLPILDSGWTWHSFWLQGNPPKGFLRVRVTQP